MDKSRASHNSDKAVTAIESVRYSKTLTDLRRYHNSWIAVQVRSRYEFVVAKTLRSKGYEDFVPTYSVKRQWSDRHKLVELPLFRNYVFCRLNADLCWPILATSGVIRIVGTRNDIGRINDSEIQSLQNIHKSKSS